MSLSDNSPPNESRHLWERLPAALYRTTLDGHVLDVNPGFVTFFRGPDRAALLNTRAEDLYVDPGDRVRWQELIRTEGSVHGFEARMRRLDGTTFWARETGGAQLGGNGDPVVYEGLIEDVTEQRTAQQALIASELRYRRLFEAAKDGILILDAKTAEIQDVNPFLCDLLDLRRDEILGLKLWEIGPFRDAPASRINFRQLQLSEYIRYDDLPLQSATGRTIAVEFVSNVYRVGDGNVIQCNIRDITERKNSTEENARLIRAVEQTAESIVMTDPQGTIVYVNPAFERISGWTHEEAVGQNARLLKSGEQGDEFYRKMWEILSRGRVWTGRFVNRRKDGTLFEEEATISPVRDAAGQVVNYVAAKRDITGERALEQQLFHAQKMEAVGRLASGIAHDFNNLLGVITGYGELLRDGMFDEDPLRDHVLQILTAANRAAASTQQLLAFGRKQAFRPVFLDLNAIVSEAGKLLSPLLGDHIELASRLEPELGSILADPRQLEQVLVNLALNARDAMPEGGRITIETANADPDAGPTASGAPIPAGPHVQLTVTDSGRGMDAATRSRAFEPFFTTKEVGKGSGLGLATVYGIVHQSHGEIFLGSEVGIGTRIEIYFPRVDAEVREPTREEAPPPPSPGVETVLLVEDERALRDLLREVLADNGYSVLVARDGQEALRLAAAYTGAIQVMVTDIVMPNLSGPEVADFVTLARPEMKVLFISGYSDETVARNASAGPGRDFLGKPFGLESLLRTVRGLLDGQGALRAIVPSDIVNSHGGIE